MYEGNLRKPMGLITVLRKTRLAECVLARVCFIFLYSIFTIVALVFYYALLTLSIQLLLPCQIVLCSCWTSHSPQDPIIRDSTAQRTEGWIVRTLWSTPALVASYLGVQNYKMSIKAENSSETFVTTCETVQIIAASNEHFWFDLIANF